LRNFIFNSPFLAVDFPDDLRASTIHQRTVLTPRPHFRQCTIHLDAIKLHFTKLCAHIWPL
jgi:hypothetical protein